MNNSKPELIIIAVTALIWGVSPNGVFAQNQTAGSRGSESALAEIIHCQIILVRDGLLLLHEQESQEAQDHQHGE